MKNQLLFFLAFSSFFSVAQIKIKGTVYQKNGVLEGAAVYLNNTMLGTTTNKNGEFTLPVKEGQYNLIISYLGFKKINYALNTATYSKPLVFVLQEEENMLDEIVIKKTIYDDNWKHNLAVFKSEFIGNTKLSKGCEILNPKVLYFDFNPKSGILTAFARKPLQIKHKSLGYLITYELESFIRSRKSITYLGYTRYQELKGSKRKQKRWKKHREKAYKGSATHFFKSVLNNTFKKEGFIVNQFKRVLNIERPSDDEIKKARQLIRLHKKNKITINISDKLPNKMTAVDSAYAIVKKARLPKFQDLLYKSKLKRADIFAQKNGVSYLSFNDNLSIVYTKEKEEMGYVTRNGFSHRRRPTFQTSSLIPLKKDIALDKSGNLVNPLDVFFEGYWSYEKMADTLPLDYEPQKD